MEETHKIQIFRDKVGQRRCKELPGNEQLLPLMEKIVDEDCAADPRRRSKVLRSTNSTSDLHRKLSDYGLRLSQSSTYRRFVPAKISSNYVKTYHTKTLNIKLSKESLQTGRWFVFPTYCL